MLVRCCLFRALIVDDDPATRELLSRTLAEEGWTVEEAENGRVPLEKLAINPPDIILLDLMMPVMDGFQFMQELRTGKSGSAVPVIVITAKLITDEDRRQLSGRVEQILEKGSQGSEQLLAEIRRLVQKSAPSRGKERAEN